MPLNLKYSAVNFLLTNIDLAHQCSLLYNVKVVAGCGGRDAFVWMNLGVTRDLWSGDTETISRKSNKGSNVGPTAMKYLSMSTSSSLE